jgi:phosphoenolpyruvate carboxykinase (ATP)
MKQKKAIEYLGLTDTGKVYRNLPVASLVEMSLLRGEGRLAENGALVVNTGLRSGRSPNDRFVVSNNDTQDVWWGPVNRPLTESSWKLLMELARNYLRRKDIFVFDGFAGADSAHRLQVRIVAEKAWHALFSSTLFIRPGADDRLNELPDFTVLNVCDLLAPDFKPLGLNSGVFVVLNFTEKIILIGGSHYAGEIKKGIFSVMNYLLPKKDVFPMHCSANVGPNGDSALFFGLSGTGKTTLSADPSRKLIGDDEHGWSDRGIFNFEGGCYAKCIKLSAENEPQIFNAIRFGSVLENVVINERRHPDFDDGSITENTRATYPVDFIDNCLREGVGPHPKNIFFLTADAFGVLPPIARLTPEQAMYHFLSGYTAKLAGTEAGVVEPSATFSACFGAPFLVHHPFTYAEMLGRAMKTHGTNLWMVNTGWSGGAFGVGQRMKISYTRALLTAALNGTLNGVEFTPDPFFKILVPSSCPGVPAEILKPRNAWSDKNMYDQTAADLANRFNNNFRTFEDRVSREVKAAAPTAQMAVGMG